MPLGTHMTEFYTAYGLCIASEFSLPELEQTPTPDTAPDLSIVDGDVPAMPDPAQGWSAISPFVQVGENRFWLNVPGVARFIVEQGRQVWVHPEPGIDAASIRVFLLGSVLGAVLFQRGFLVLHGNAIDINGRAMVCLGHSGAGKSTLAAAFAARGYPVLADDVVPVDTDCNAVPGFPRIKLWQDSADRLEIATGDLDRIRPELNKFNMPVRDTFCATPLPIRWVYLLTTDNRDEITLTPISGLNRFQPLLAHTYRRRFMEGMALRPDHLQRCGALAGRVHLARVQRPGKGFDIDGLVDTLLADMAQAG